MVFFSCFQRKQTYHHSLIAKRFSHLTDVSKSTMKKICKMHAVSKQHIKTIWRIKCARLKRTIYIHRLKYGSIDGYCWLYICRDSVEQKALAFFPDHISTRYIVLFLALHNTFIVGKRIIMTSPLVIIHSNSILSILLVRRFYWHLKKEKNQT